MSVPGDQRCAWSNRADAGTREILLPARRAKERPIAWRVCPRHENQVRVYHERMQRDRTRFIIGVVLVILAAPMAVFFEPEVGIAMLLAMAGTVLYAFPFAAPLTVLRNGIARSMLIVRALGALLLGFAALFLLAAFL